MTDWPRIAITVLTVAAFGLATGGLLHAFTSTRRIAGQVDADIETRRRLRRQHDRDEVAIRARNLGPQQQKDELKATAERWIEAHADLGLEPWTYTHVDEGRELVAERLAHQLSQATRSDLYVVGAGLLLGLLASVWSVWL